MNDSQLYNIWKQELILDAMKGNCKKIVKSIITMHIKNNINKNNINNNNNWWKLSMAIQILTIGFEYGKIEIVKLCINETKCTWMPLDFSNLNLAVKFGHIDIVDWVLPRIAITQPNLYNSIKNSTDYKFQHACYQGDLISAMNILSNQSTINAKYYISANNGSVLRWAKKQKHSHIVRWLQQKMDEYRPKASIKINTKKKSVVYKSEIELCNICQETPSELETGCKHPFCNDCIQKWYITSAKKDDLMLGQCKCPTCRQNVDELFTLALLKTSTKKQRKTKKNKEIN